MDDPKQEQGRDQASPCDDCSQHGQFRESASYARAWSNSLSRGDRRARRPPALAPARAPPQMSFDDTGALVDDAARDRPH